MANKFCLFCGGEFYSRFDYGTPAYCEFCTQVQGMVKGISLDDKRDIQVDWFEALELHGLDKTVRKELADNAPLAFKAYFNPRRTFITFEVHQFNTQTNKHDFSCTAVPVKNLVKFFESQKEHPSMDLGTALSGIMLRDEDTEMVAESLLNLLTENGNLAMDFNNA